MTEPAAVASPGAAGDAIDAEPELVSLLDPPSALAPLRLHLRPPTATEHAFCIWRSARLFAALAAAPTGPVRRACRAATRALELGAGSGVLSLHLARAAALACCATDLPHVLPRLQRNLALNAPASAAPAAAAASAPTSALAFEWGAGVQALFPDSSPPFDLILGTDLVLSMYRGDHLVRSLAQLALLCELRMAAEAAARLAPCRGSARSWLPAWRAQPCRVLLLNQLRERGVQAAFECRAARVLRVRRGGGGALLAAARGGSDEFILYRMRIRRDVCGADIGLTAAAAAACGLHLAAAAARGLVCPACAGSGEGDGGGAAPLPANADASLVDAAVVCSFCYLCGAGRPVAVPPPLLDGLTARAPPATAAASRARFAHANPLAANSLFAAGLAGISIAL